MPALTSLAVADGKATPVTHTFIPNGEDNGVDRFRESTGVLVGDPSITVSLRKSGSNHKVRIVLAVPVVVNETVNGVTIPRVARTAFADLTITHSESSLPAERKDLSVMLSNLLKETTISKVLNDLEYLY